MMSEHRLPPSPTELRHGNGTAVIKGDSMQPTVQSGATIRIAATEYAKNNDVVIVRIGGEILCKRIKYRHDGILLLSDNPKHPVMHCDHEEIVVIGKAVK